MTCLSDLPSLGLYTLSSGSLIFCIELESVRLHVPAGELELTHCDILVASLGSGLDSNPHRHGKRVIK